MASEAAAVAPVAPEPPNITKSQAQSQASSSIVGTTCMELALEGERLCKTGDFKNGVKFFEEAIKVGSADNRTLSAIYSQLGNAYFYLEDYQKALAFHKQDVALVNSIGDEIAEAKACGNLGNTFKMLAKFDEAAIYCRRHLEISRKLADKIGEGRALYNLGNVYHTQGKRMISTNEQEPGELSSDIRSSLQRAIEYYEANLRVVVELKDFASMGRAYGNLGNTHYLLGNFELAVDSHKKRLELAKQTNDKSAERRAHLNLGNANVFLGNFQEAIQNYSATLKLAQELQDKYTEAHSCYSLANTHTFLREYDSAIAYHLKYLELIDGLDDKLGEGRACWSLVNIYQMVNDPESALVFAKKHREIADLLGDKAGLASANLNIEELQEAISDKQAALAACPSIGSGEQLAGSIASGKNSTSRQTHAKQSHNIDSGGIFHLSTDKRQEQEQRRFKKQLNSNLTTDIDGVATRCRASCDRGPVKSSSSERLFDMIAHFQSGRIDDQRCEILKRPTQQSKLKSKVSEDKENNRASNGAIDNNVTSLPNVNRSSQPSINPLNAVSVAASAIKATYRKASLATYSTTSNASSSQSQPRPVVSAEHRDQLFDLIAGAQGQRMDEQRASLPALQLANGNLKNPTNAGLLSRGHTVDHSSSSSSSGNNTTAKTQTQPKRQPETIQEQRIRGKSHSIIPGSTNFAVRPPTGSTPASIVPIKPTNDLSGSSSKQRTAKLSRHFQTVDADHQVHGEKFLDSLMKYQSTRFDDQRSEFPKKRERAGSLAQEADTGQAENFFNLIVRFQSDRIDDQRSAPPNPNNKNI